jgi:hypothetical protein
MGSSRLHKRSDVEKVVYVSAANPVSNRAGRGTNGTLLGSSLYGMRCFMARLIEFYKPRGFTPALALPAERGKLIEFPLTKIKKLA